jgi:hypothetical protein
MVITRRPSETSHGETKLNIGMYSVTQHQRRYRATRRRLMAPVAAAAKTDLDRTMHVQMRRSREDSRKTNAATSMADDRVRWSGCAHVSLVRCPCGDGRARPGSIKRNVDWLAWGSLCASCRSCARVVRLHSWQVKRTRRHNTRHRTRTHKRTHT